MILEKFRLNLARGYKRVKYFFTHVYFLEHLDKNLSRRYEWQMA